MPSTVGEQVECQFFPAIRVHNARALLDCYGVTDLKREEVLELVRLSRRKAWWHALLGHALGPMP